MKIEVERILAHVVVESEADVQRIVKNYLDRLTRLIKSDIVKSVEATSQDDLHPSWFDSCNGLKTAMFNLTELGLAEVVRCGRGHTVTELEFRRPVQSRSGTERIVRTVLSSTTSIFPMAEIIHNLKDEAFDEKRLR